MSEPVPVEPSGHRGLQLVDRAVADLRFIRDAMERSGRFTAVPGRAWVGMGSLAVFAAAFASTRTSETTWLATWIAAAVIATGIGACGIKLKARGRRISIFSGPGRMFFLGLGPPLVAATLLTLVLFRVEQVDLLPATWLLLYGAAVMSGGVFSIPVVPFAGVCFMALGCLTFVLPHSWHDAALAVGFGGFHILFGSIVWRRHGG